MLRLIATENQILGEQCTREYDLCQSNGQFVGVLEDLGEVWHYTSADRRMIEIPYDMEVVLEILSEKYGTTVAMCDQSSTIH